MSSTKADKSLVHQLDSNTYIHSRITKISFRTDFSYFSGRAGIIRILNLILSAIGIVLLIPGYNRTKLSKKDESENELIRMMDSEWFSGYGKSQYTLASIALGGSCAFITLVFILLLLCIMEVRCDVLWEKINQKANVLCCILSVLAAFLDVLSIEKIQQLNCKTTRCKFEHYNTKISKFEQEFYPPFFVEHYAAFVLFLTNAMLYSIASRIWLRNED